MLQRWAGHDIAVCRGETLQRIPSTVIRVEINEGSDSAQAGRMILPFHLPRSFERHLVRSQAETSLPVS